MNAAIPPPLVQMEIASPYRRLVARLVDFAVAMFVLFPVGMLLSTAINALTKGSAATTALTGFLDVLCLVLVLLTYETLMTHLLGWTVGKKALGLKIVDINGEKLGWGMALLRAFLFGVFACLVIAGLVITATILGWILFAGLGRWQRFPHEQATRSFVMRTGVSTAPAAVKPSPYAGLDDLRAAGMISEEEYQRKKKELGL